MALCAGLFTAHGVTWAQGGTETPFVRSSAAGGRTSQAPPRMALLLLSSYIAPTLVAPKAPYQHSTPALKASLHHWEQPRVWEQHPSWERGVIDTSDVPATDAAADSAAEERPPLAVFGSAPPEARASPIMAANSSVWVPSAGVVRRLQARQAASRKAPVARSSPPSLSMLSGLPTDAIVSEVRKRAMDRLVPASALMIALLLLPHALELIR